MSIENFDLPDVGEGLTEAEILSWKVAPGDEVAVNQILVEIETAKAAVELPSPYAGRVQALLVQPGITVDVGTPIIAIDTDPAGAGDATTAPASDTPPGTDQVGTDPASVRNGAEGAKIGEVAADGRIATLVGFVDTTVGTRRRARRGPATEPTTSAVAEAGDPGSPGPAVKDESMTTGDGGRGQAPKAAPPVRKLAKELGVDLASVQPGRADGVISRSEVEAAGRPVAAPQAQGTDGVDRRIPIKGVRKATAAAMVASAFTAPHVSVFLTIDITPTMQLRDRLRRRPEFKDVKLSPLTFAARAVCLALRRTPELNSTWDEAAGEIVLKHAVHLGIAAATPRGLVVPKIRDAHRLDLAGLARELTDLTEVARAGRTTPAAMAGGTFTITNIGVLGVDSGTPILNPGESGILALGSVKDTPWVVDGQLAVRQVCQLSLSFDHRVVDGRQGAAFLADVGALLSDPGLALVW